MNAFPYIENLPIHHQRICCAFFGAKQESVCQLKVVISLSPSHSMYIEKL